MKSSIKGLFVILAIVVSLVAVQNVSAETVEGTIESISTRPNVVVVDGTEVYGVKLNYLCNQYTICLDEGETVSFLTYEFTCSDGTIKLMACNITVGDVTVALRTCQ